MAGFFNDIVVASPVLFVIWVVIASAYMPELAGCQMRRILGTSILAKHVTGLFVIYFTIVTVNEDMHGSSIVKRVGLTFMLYTLFVLTTRCDANVILAIMGVLFVIYFMYGQRKDIEDENKRDQLDKTIVRLFYVTLFMTAVGVTIFAMRKQQEFGADFDWATFFIGRMHCDSLRADSTEVIEQL